MLQLFDSIIVKNYSSFSFIVSIGVEFKNYKIIRIVMENDCEYNYKLIVSGYEKGRYEKLKVPENIDMFMDKIQQDLEENTNQLFKNNV